MPKIRTSRQELITKSFEVFRQMGYYGASVADLSRACGIPKSHFYYYFPEGKAAIMLACLEMVADLYEQKVLAAPTEPDLSPGLQLERLLNRFRRVVTEGDGGCFMANTVLAALHAEPRFRPVLRRFFDGMRTALARIYAHRFSAENALWQADHVLQDFEGGVMLMRLYGDTAYVDEAIRRALVPFSAQTT